MSCWQFWMTNLVRHIYSTWMKVMTCNLAPLTVWKYRLKREQSDGPSLSKILWPIKLVMNDFTFILLVRVILKTELWTCFTFNFLMKVYKNWPITCVKSTAMKIFASGWQLISLGVAQLQESFIESTRSISEFHLKLIIELSIHHRRQL